VSALNSFVRRSRHDWPLRHVAAAALLSLGAVALVSGAVFALEPVAPVLSLGVLYLFAVLPVAAIWGLPFALPVSIVSMLAFNFLFLPPKHTFRLADSENWVALAVYLVTAITVSALAARARRRAAEAEQRRREATLAADISAILLQSREVEPRLPEIAARVARLLGVGHAYINLEPLPPPDGEWDSYELAAGTRVVGQLYVDASANSDRDIAHRVSAMLASLLATAIDRERLAREAREIEARRRSEAIEAESLRQSDAAKTAVLRAVSHDLRSPITAIIAASEILDAPRRSVRAEDRSELVASIRDQAQRLHRLVSNLLELSRLEADAAQPERELWTIDGLIARSLEVLGPESKRVDVVLPTHSSPVEVDSTQLERALVNLVENALKFSAPNEHVLVHVQVAGDEIIVRVVGGPAIPAHEQERIFEPFVRGVSSEAERGSGLGLAIARGFVNLNRGRLWVESTASERTVFALALPTVTAPARLPA
jgi:two-component system, OmpR family, sensor histidine kinase KdpD